MHCQKDWHATTTNRLSLTYFFPSFSYVCFSFSYFRILVSDYPRVLIAIPSPRDLPQFAEAVNKIPADKLFCKYMHEQQAYDTIRENFLTSANEQYTHLAILPDDLIVTPYHWQQLVEDLHEYDFPVLCGV